MCVFVGAMCCHYSAAFGKKPTVAVLKAGESRSKLLIFVNADEIRSSITSLFVTEDQKAFRSRPRLISVSLIILEFDPHEACSSNYFSPLGSTFIFC